MNYKYCLLVLTLLFTYSSNAQKFEIEGYFDTYYSNYSTKTDDLQAYSTIAPFTDRIGVNFAQFGLHYQDTLIRSNMVLHFGDITKSVWSPSYRYIQEANVGLHIIKNWWVDIGFFRTHIGTESFLPKLNYLSTTAVATYNEPFYQGGARLAYEGSSKFDLELWIVNGYNQFADINRQKSFGLLFTYHIAKHTSITYTNLYGNEAPTGDPVENRFYQNMYINSEILKNLHLQIGADYGIQEVNGENQSMYNYLATVRYQITPKFSLTGRYERFKDETGFVSGIFSKSGVPKGLQMEGFTIGTEFIPQKNSYLRAEFRKINLDDNDANFVNEGGLVSSRNEFIITLGHYFTKGF